MIEKFKKNDLFKTYIFFGILLIFILILSFTIISFYFLGKGEEVPFFLNIFVKYHVFFMFLIAILGLVFGTFTHFFLNRKIDVSKEKYKLMKDFFFKVLNLEEKKIIFYLLENNGVSNQYDLTKLENMNKIKVHRTLEKLEKEGLVKKKKIGKINKIILEKEFFKCFN